MTTATLCAPRKRKSSAGVAILDRKSFVQALDRARLVAAARSCKPILACVRLEIAAGVLTIQATDLDISLMLQLPAEGELAPTVVPCSELMTRLKAGKDEKCNLHRAGDKLIINGGRVEHALQTLDPAEFPLVARNLEGDTLDAHASELCRALAVTAIGAARETTRYAINGILLEAANDQLGLIATDGRRMVLADVPATSQFTGQAILPLRYCKLIEKFGAKCSDFVTLGVKRESNDKGEPLPARLFAAGPDWLLSTTEIEGQFPRYSDVVPASASRFEVDRRELLETLDQVAIAATDSYRAVGLVLSSRKIALAAGTPGAGATGSIRAKFLGGGDSAILTAFNPTYLIDAVKSLDADRIIIDVNQNGCGSNGEVFGKPALLYSAENPTVRWLMMPVNAGLEPGPKSLGSNYRPPEQPETA